VLEKRRVAQVDDDVEITETDTRGAAAADACAAYFADTNKAADRGVVFDTALGLAIEGLPSGASLQTLWEVV
jgi:Bardet-Biedl syndrome 5 protein